MPVLSSFILVSLDNSQDHFDNPLVKWGRLV
jgi:hypothetical protein